VGKICISPSFCDLLSHILHFLEIKRHKIEDVDENLENEIFEYLRGGHFLYF
jgi:hypothetical protein